MASTASDATRLNGIAGSSAPAAATASAAVHTRARAPAHSWIVAVRQDASGRRRSAPPMIGAGVAVGPG